MVPVNLGIKRLAQRLAQEMPLKKFALYGAGDLGVECFRVFSHYKVTIEFFMDKKAENGEFSAAGKHVYGIKTAPVDDISAIIIASEAYYEEIASDIREALGSKAPVIFSLHGDKEYLSDCHDVFSYPDSQTVWLNYLAQNTSESADEIAKCVGNLKLFKDSM